MSRPAALLAAAALALKDSRHAYSRHCESQLLSTLAH